MDWATTDKVEEDRRKKQTKKYTKMGLETIKRLAGIIAEGSEYLIRVSNGARTVLVLTDVDYWESVREDHLELPQNIETLWAGFGTGMGRRSHYTPAELAFAQQLRVLYPKGLFFFAKSKLAHTELLNAIAAPQAGPIPQVRSQPQAQNSRPRRNRQTSLNNKSRRKGRPQVESNGDSESDAWSGNEQSEDEQDSGDEIQLQPQQSKARNTRQGAADNKSSSTSPVQAKKTIGRKSRQREESEEELESDTLAGNDELQGNALEKEWDSDIEIIEPKEEERDSDIEIVENPGGWKKRRPSLRNPSLKRSRALATSDEDEDNSNTKPPSPTPQPIPTKNKKAGGASREGETRQSNRFKDRTVGQQAVDIGYQYSSGVLARSKAREMRRSGAQDHYQQGENYATLAKEARMKADSYDDLAREERIKGRYQLERMESDEEVEVEEGEAYRAAQKKLMAPQKTAKFV